MPTRTRSPRPRPVPKSYLTLNAAFPLRAIRSDEELAAALDVVGELMRRELDEGETDYLDVLVDIVHKYESAAHPIPDATEADVLRLLMAERALSQPALAKGAGIAQSTISAVLTGTRTLTKEHVVKLAAYFKVSPAVFLPKL